MASLKIEIETESIDGIYGFLRRVTDEITHGPEYQLEGIPENDFIKVKDFNGKYKWSLD